MQVTSNTAKIKYSKGTLERAKVALICSGFCLPLFVTMMKQSVPLPLIAGKNGLIKGYTTRKLPEIFVENELAWLIEIGLLRREVDGQGITDSFRITPLGRRIIAEYEQLGGHFPKATIWQKITNFFTRWLKIS